MISGDTSDGYHTFNELYENRHILFLALLSANKDKAWRSKLHDDGSFLDGWFIAGLKTDLGQATYHLPLRMWGLFHNIKEVEHAPKWDGHTSEDVLTRIREFALHPSKQEPPPIDVEAITDIAWDVFFNSDKPAPYNQMKDVILYLAAIGRLKV